MGKNSSTTGIQFFHLELEVCCYRKDNIHNTKFFERQIWATQNVRKSKQSKTPQHAHSAVFSYHHSDQIGVSYIQGGGGLHVFHLGGRTLHRAIFCIFGRRIFASFVSYTAKFWGAAAPPRTPVQPPWLIPCFSSYKRHLLINTVTLSL